MKAGLMALATAVMAVMTGWCGDEVNGKWWSMNTTRTIGGEHRLVEFSGERFNVWGKRGQAHLKFAQTDILKKVGKDLWTQTVFMFSCRSATGRLIRVTPLLELRDGATNKLLRAEKIIWRGNQWRNFQFPLNELFPLGDTGIHVVRMGFTVDVENWNPGENGYVELKNIRLCKAGEVSFSGNVAEDRITVVPSRPLHAFKSAPDALRIFFAFDNEDVIDSIDERDGRRDEQQDGGFRERLLENLDGAATWTTNLDQADLIVYSRARKDPVLAARIAAAVKERGVPLYAASVIADEEVSALLPCTLAARDPKGFAPRSALVAADAPAALTADLSKTTFGIYRECAAKDGAKTLVRFADGTPAVLEGTAGKGRVLYSMPAIGQTVVPDRRAYDAFFVRVASHLTGRKLPEAKYDGCPFALGDGWYRGIGGGEFGRFGWEIGSGLLIEHLGNTFRVSNGDSEYTFRDHADRTAMLREMTFAGDAVSSLSFGGRIAVNGRPFARFDGSLAYPGTRWEFVGDEIDMDVTDLMDFVAVPTKDGVKVVDAKAGTLPPAAEWTEPWLLMFCNKAKASPLMVTLAKRPDAARILVEDNVPAALAFVRKGGVGAVITTWLYGAEPVNASAWAGGVPAEAIARARFWTPRAFLYPITIEEKFRVSADGRRFEIVDRYGYRETKDEWNTARRPYAPVPPLARFMDDMFVTPDAVEARLATRFGDYADLDGADTVRWSLPVPSPDLSLLPHTLGFEKYFDIANDEFAHAVNFSCGGRTPLDGRTLEFPRGPHQPTSYNLDMHTMLLGMCRCLPNPFGYNAANRALMMRRARLRELEPLEVAPYKMAVRYRREPFTDYPYTIYMHSWRSLITTYEPKRLGSVTMYGDSNETVRMIAATLQMLADRHGQTGAVAANWETVRRFVPSYAFALDDWLLMCAGCIEDWAVSGIDMLNTEYGTMCSMARLAEIAGDDDLRTVCLYRAARRAVPSIARLRLKHYFAKHGMIADAARVSYSAGYVESGPYFKGRTVRKVEDVDLYDMSQGIPQDLISLYERYAGTAIRDDYMPQVEAATVTNGLNWIMTSILALGGDVSESQMIERLDAVAANKSLHDFHCSDWPGMDTGSYLEFIFAKYRGTPRLTDCRDLDLHDAVYDPSTKTLKLDFTPGPNAALAVDGKPVAIKGAGRQIINVRLFPR